MRPGAPGPNRAVSNGRIERTGWVAPGIFEIVDGIHRIPCLLPGDGLQAVNVYVIEQDDGVAIIDTGTASRACSETIVDGLRRLGRTPADISVVLCTHAHYDHFGGTTWIRTATSAPVMTGRGELAMLRVAFEPGAGERWSRQRRDWLIEHDAQEVVRAIERRAGFRDAIDEAGGWVAPDRLLDDGERVRLDRGDLTVVHTPGHTRGHVMFRDEASGVVFAGDHVLPHITPSLGFEARTDGRALAYYLTALASTRELDATLVAPGHGPVFHDLRGRVDELLDHHERRLCACATLLERRGPVSARVVAEGLPWTRHERGYAELDELNQMLAVTETLTHLELLVERGVARRIDGRPVRYAASALRVLCGPCLRWAS